MIGISHLLRRVSQVWVTIGALVQQLILLVASYSSKWDFYCCLCLSSFSVFLSSLHRLRLLSQFRILSPIFLFRSLDCFFFERVVFSCYFSFFFLIFVVYVRSNSTTMDGKYVAWGCDARAHCHLPRANSPT